LVGRRSSRRGGDQRKRHNQEARNGRRDARGTCRKKTGTEWKTPTQDPFKRLSKKIGQSTKEKGKPSTSLNKKGFWARTTKARKQRPQHPKGSRYLRETNLSRSTAITTGSGRLEIVELIMTGLSGLGTNLERKTDALGEISQKQTESRRDVNCLSQKNRPGPVRVQV